MNSVLDIDTQRCIVDAHKRQLHEQWVNRHLQVTKLDHECSKIRAQLLVNEAWRNEKIHLSHQLIHCKKLLETLNRNPHSPRRIACESHEKVDCACVRAPIYRQLTPKYRAMNVLQGHFPESKLEAAVESLRQTYSNDHEMISDLLHRYGPEDETVNPRIWLKSIDERIKTCDARWQEIGAQVKNEMMHRDNFPTVIRNLSIMRIFLEGSQAPVYSCDVSERARRDQFHQDVLDRLLETGQLFL